MSFMQSKQKSGVVRYALNLVVLVTFLFSNFGLGYAMPIRQETSMLRQSAANSRLETTVAAMGVELLQDTYARSGRAGLVALLSDRAIDGVEDPVEQGLIKDNVAVVERDGRTYIVGLIGNGWKLDLSNPANQIAPFTSVEERDKFISGGQLTWLAGEYTPRQLIDAQAGAKKNLQDAGNEGRIFVAEDLPGQVAKYSATRTSVARQLPPLSEKEQKALAARLQAAFGLQRQAIDGITQKDINAMVAIGLAPMFPIAVGAEDFSAEGGPAVGRITLNHLNEIGLRDTVVGHSATRSHVLNYEKMADGSLKWGSKTRASAGDTSEVVAEKLRQALAAGMKVTYCIGEDLFIRQQGKATSHVIARLDRELGSLNLTGEQVLGLLEAVAYEPLWAIGTGVPANNEDIQEMHAAIRQWFADKYGQEVASKLIIEYGGSVNTDNAREIFALPDVDGALIGGASLKAASFSEIARIADDVGRKQGKFMHISANWKAEEVAKRDDLRQHLSALEAAGLSNTVIRYYLPFTILAESKNIVNDAISASVDEIKKALRGVRQAMVLDEDGNPSFFYQGDVDSSKFVAITASSGGYRYAGYDYEQSGRIPPRSIYETVAMAESYMEMAKTDPEALRAYRLKLLHEYLEVSGESKFHRIESPEVAALINKYDAKALEMWKAREAEKARVKILEVENKKTIAEATSANMGKFLRGRVIPSELIEVVNAELKKIAESGLLTRYRVVADNGKLTIFTARQKSKAIEDDAKIPAAVLNVFLTVLERAKALQLFTGEDIASKSFSQQAAALEITTPLPTLSYIEPEGWAQSVFSKVRTELVEPVGQAKGFFTTDYHGYTLSGLLAAPREQIPDEVVQAVRNKLSQYIAEGKILGADVRDGGATDIDILVTHRYGELNATVQRLVLDAMRGGCVRAQQLGLFKSGVDITAMSISELGKALRVKYQTHSIVERKSEPVVIAKIIGAGIGASNVKLYHEFFMPGSTPLKKLGFVPEGKVGVRGFRAIVRRVEDVLKGNSNGPVWEFETSSAFKDASGKQYPSRDESLELLALASQPNDFVITAIYTVEGSTVPSTEPIISVVYQPVYTEEGNLRTLNPTFICRSQSGADAVGGVASMFYDVNFVPGGPNGERYVVTRPVTLEEARKAPKEGTAHVAIYGWQSKGNGVIPTEAGTVVDHVAINPPALNPERDLADFLASVMTTHQHDQPYLAPFAAQEQVEPLRETQSHIFMRAPKEADIDSVMDEVEAKVVTGEYLAVDDDKADMGGVFGHNFTPAYMLAIDMATVMEAIEQGTLTDGNIIGLIEKMRLTGLTPDIGDDSHVLMLGDKSRNSAQSHQLSFLAFVRGYLGAVVAGEKPYGLAQDFAGREAKAAMQNPYFYSKFNERFFEILRTVMPSDYMSMVDKMEDGWRKWQATGESETVLTKGFSGNVSNQGIGSARYLVDIGRPFATLDGIDVSGKTVLVRPDINVQAENGHIVNPEKPHNRVVEAAKTLKELADKNAKVVVIFHQGRLGSADFMDTPEEHAAQLSRLTGKPIKTVNDLFGQEATAAIQALNPGEILVLKPVRSEDPANLGKILESNPSFVATLKPLVDFFVLDGFSVAHRDSPSVTGIQGIPAIAGRLMEREIKGASSLLNPPKPHLLVVGGGKVTEKLTEMVSALETGKVAKVIVGGRLANLMLIAMQPQAAAADTDDKQYQLAAQTLGQATADDLKEFLGGLPRLVQLLAKYRDKIELPTDAVYLEGEVRHEVDLADGRVSEGFNYLLSGIGPKTAQHYAAVASRTEQPFKSAFVIGPLSDSRYAVLHQETRTVLNAVAKLPFWSTGGGDTESLVRELGFIPTYTSLAGGALAEFMTGKELPGVKLLVENDPALAGRERQFGILAGDKMGPAALNRPIREAVYAAIAAGEFENGLVFEIWDAKAYDHLGNIPINELPSAFSDVEESINELKDAAEQEIVRAAYPNGQLNVNLDSDSRTTVASLLKKAGYVPSKRIFLDAQKDKEAIYLYLADSDRFNIKQVWSKKQTGWDIENPTAYLLKPVLGSSVTKLGILAGGEYIGKDDPVMVGNMQLMKHVYEFLKVNPLIIQGDMNGSHWLAAIPTAAKYAVANKESHPIIVGLVYTLSEDGTKLASVEDIFGKEEYDGIRNTMFKFDFEFKKAQLGGQFEPYGTNWRTVEASYPLAKLLRALQAPNSPFLVKNKPASTRTSRPVGIIGETADVFNAIAESFEMPSAPAGWQGPTDAQQRFYKSLLALQSSGVSHKLSEAVLAVAKDAANRKVILISASVLRNDPTLILALQSINEQINQNLGIFGNASNVEANAYQFVLVADDVALRTTKDVDEFFAAIAKATNNGVVVNKDMFAKIITQEDMLEGQITNPADLLRQLNRMGIPTESIVSVVGSNKWTSGISSASGSRVTSVGPGLEAEISEGLVVVDVDTQDNKVAFASNGLFGAVETLATTDRKLPEPIVEKLDIALLPSGAMQVKQEEVDRRVSDEITAYRATVKAI